MKIDWLIDLMYDFRLASLLEVVSSARDGWKIENYKDEQSIESPVHSLIMLREPWTLLYYAAVSMH